MKLRLTGNSVRLRLTQSEVKALSEKGLVEECVPLSPQSLRVELRSGQTQGPVATFSGGALRVQLPSKDVTDWVASDRVGMEGDCNGVRLLVEKDFQCLHPADPAENADTFPNPGR